MINLITVAVVPAQKIKYDYHDNSFFIDWFFVKLSSHVRWVIELLLNQVMKKIFLRTQSYKKYFLTFLKIEPILLDNKIKSYI